MLQLGAPGDLAPVELSLAYRERKIESRRHDYRLVVKPGTGVMRSCLIGQSKCSFLQDFWKLTSITTLSKSVPIER